MGAQTPDRLKKFIEKYNGLVEAVYLLVLVLAYLVRKKFLLCMVNTTVVAQLSYITYFVFSHLLPTIGNFRVANLILPVILFSCTLKI